MTKAEAAQLVAILVGHYPNAKFTRENAEAWTETLQQLDAQRAHAAVKKLIQTEKWLPSLAHIFELVLPPPREYLAPYHVPFPEEGPLPQLPGKVIALARRAVQAMPPARARGTLDAEQAKSRMLLEDAEARGELTDEQRAQLARLAAQAAAARGGT